MKKLVCTAERSTDRFSIHIDVKEQVRAVQIVRLGYFDPEEKLCIGGRLDEL
jgi:hypothetical protein